MSTLLFRKTPYPVLLAQTELVKQLSSIVYLGIIARKWVKFFLTDSRSRDWATYEVAALGIARTYQNIRLFKQLTALENILVGAQPHLTTGWFSAVLRTRKFKSEEYNALLEATHLLDHVGLNDCGDTVAVNLPYGAQRRLEIARALANRPSLLLLDEPTAGMNPQETESMAKFIATLRDDFNLTIVLIEHDMSVVMGISEQISVFRSRN